VTLLALDVRLPTAASRERDVGKQVSAGVTTATVESLPLSESG
jgi:hypothetical protein